MPNATAAPSNSRAPSPEFWQGRKVLITGHTGFKGGWLNLWLSMMGAKIIGYALHPPENDCFFRESERDGTLVSHRADIRDRAAITTLLKEFEPEIVFHLAAESLVLRAHQYPVATFDTNVMGTVNLLEALRSVPSVKSCVIVTTDKVYKQGEDNRGFVESDSLGALEPYGASKAACEFVVESYRHSYFDESIPSIGIASARSGNVLGGGDWCADRLVPDAIRAFRTGDTLPIRHPNAVRPWQYVLEPLCGYLLLAEALHDAPDKFNKAWNFGSGIDDSWPVSAIANRLVELWQGDAHWEGDKKLYPYESQILRLDSTRSKKELEWMPILDLGEALEWTVQWYKAHHSGQEMSASSRACIEQYVTRLNHQVSAA